MEKRFSIALKAALGLLSLLCLHGAAAADVDPENPVYATIGEDTKITWVDLDNHTRTNIALAPHLYRAGGPMRILNDLINMRLLRLEAAQAGIQKTPDDSETTYALGYLKRVAPLCTEPDAQTARQFFETHQDRFSTPTMLRLNRLGKRFDPADRGAVEYRLSAIADAIRGGVKGFEDFAEENDDDVSRLKKGDVGFVPDTDPNNPVLSRLRSGKIGEVLGPFAQGNMLFIYQITARREPILASYEAVQPEVVKEYRTSCTEERRKKLFATLKEKWHVKILVEDIGHEPGTLGLPVSRPRP